MTAEITEEDIHVTIDRASNRLVFSGPAINGLSEVQRRRLHEHMTRELPAVLASVGIGEEQEPAALTS